MIKEMRTRTENQLPRRYLTFQVAMFGRLIDLKSGVELKLSIR